MDDRQEDLYIAVARCWSVAIGLSTFVAQKPFDNFL